MSDESNKGPGASGEFRAGVPDEDYMFVPKVYGDESEVGVKHWVSTRDRHDRDAFRRAVMAYAHEVQPDCVGRRGWERVVMGIVEGHPEGSPAAIKDRIDRAAWHLRLYLEAK